MRRKQLKPTIHMQQVTRNMLHLTLHVPHCNVARKITCNVMSVGILVVITNVLHTHAAITRAGDV